MLLLLAFSLTQFVHFPSLRDVRGRIQGVIADTFGLDPKQMYLTKPTFFSRINSTIAKTQHDEYWHPHVDKVRHRTVTLSGGRLLELYLTELFGGGYVTSLFSNL